jgi:hypothetical protein
MIKMLHKMGIKSGHMYTAGMASIGVAFASWVMSRNLGKSDLARADRWGIFVGQWAPTFMAIGVALRIEETHRGMDAESEMDMLDRKSGDRAHDRTHVNI